MYELFYMGIWQRCYRVTTSYHMINLLCIQSMLALDSTIDEYPIPVRYRQGRLDSYNDTPTPTHLILHFPEQVFLKQEIQNSNAIYSQGGSAPPTPGGRKGGSRSPPHSATTEGGEILAYPAPII